MLLVTLKSEAAKEGGRVLKKERCKGVKDSREEEEEGKVFHFPLFICEGRNGPTLKHRINHRKPTERHNTKTVNGRILDERMRKQRETVKLFIGKTK